MVRPLPQPSPRSETSRSPPAWPVTVSPRVAILVVTADDGLWTPLAAIAHGRDAHQFDSAAELIGQWESGRAAVVLIDGRGGAGLETAVQQILTHGTALVPVAVVDEDARVAAAGLERKRSLFDHLLLPLDNGTARTVIERAAEEAAARLSLAAGDLPTPPAVPPARARFRGRGVWIAIAVAVMLGAAGAAWWLMRPSAPEASRPPSAASPAPAAGTPVPAGSATAVPAAPAEEVEAQLERARSAMRDKHYVEPPPGSALAHYKTVLDLDPQNGEARQGLDRIAEILIARAGSAMASRDYAAALRALETARSLKPGHPRLAALDAQVNQRLKELSVTQVQAALQANAFARAAALLSQAEKTNAIPAEQIAQLRADATRREAAAQLNEVERLAQVRISQGRLLEPAGDSAKFYLRQLQERGGSAVADALTRLNDSYAKRLAGDARAAIGRAAWADVDALLGELKTVNGGASLAQAQALQREADRAREQSRMRAAEAAEAKVNADAAREASAPAAGSAPAAPVVATAPKLAKTLTLDYPVRAAAAGIEGWVEIRFDVSAAGVPENLRVLAAQPAGTFDSAALAAIRRARFTPAKTADGTPISTPASLRLRFTLSDRK